MRPRVAASPPSWAAATCAYSRRERHALRGRLGLLLPSWRGGFYPADAKSDSFLRLYAERVNTVELNNTFYRVPEDDQFDRWAAQVPPASASA